MRPVDQEFLSGNAENIPGDCVRACVATILELDREQVPHFVREHDSHWASALDDWLEARGIELVHLEGHRCYGFPMMWVGAGPRGPRHAVVGQADDLAHDPHPSRAGLVGLADRTFLFLPKHVDWAAYFAPREA